MRYSFMKQIRHKGEKNVEEEMLNGLRKKRSKILGENKALKTLIDSLGKADKKDV